MRMTHSQLITLIILRVLIGWHLLYEGLTKLLNPSWTSKWYLLDSNGIFSDIFVYLTKHSTLLLVVDYLNIFGLILFGLCLIIGIFAKWSCYGASLLLFVYYLSHIPYVGIEYTFPQEGTYMWIDKNIIESVTLIVLALFPTSHIIGIDRILRRK